jgi:hypothetical protein
VAVLGLFFAATRFGLRGYFYMIRVRKSESPSPRVTEDVSFFWVHFDLKK